MTNRQFSAKAFLDEETPSPVEAETGQDIGALLLGIVPCQDVLEGVLSRLPTFVQVRFNAFFPAFPAMLDHLLVASIWRLSAGDHRLDLGVLPFAGEEPIATATTVVTLPETQTHTWLSAFKEVPIPTPGLYRLVGRCEGQILGGVPFAIEERQ